MIFYTIIIDRTKKCEGGEHMRVERLTSDKVRFFLTFDDLHERSIDKEDLWRDVPKVHQLFNDMMEQAYYELGFEVSGPVAVEVFALPSQGMVVIVTKGRQELPHDDDDQHMHDTFELEVMMDESDDVVYAFRELEDVIQVAHRAVNFVPDSGRLYHYKNVYILYFHSLELEEKNFQALIALLEEYGEIYPITEAVLDEYGKLIIADNAFVELTQHFQ